MKVTFKRIICKYDNPCVDDGATGYMLYWNEPDYDHDIQVSKHSIVFWLNSETPTIDYFANGQTDETSCSGLQFTDNEQEDYEHCTLTIEFTNGNKVEYKCPEEFSKFVSDFKDFVDSNYTCVPGTSVMSRAANLLDDEMQYEI
jgi:hypothetical protein